MASTTRAAAPSAAARARATAPACWASRRTRASRARTRASRRRTTGTTACRHMPPPPFFDPSLNTGFVTGRGTGGSVTYGDPEIGGRMPRYQNWNAGVQYALRTQLTVGASYAGSRGDFLGGSGRGFYANQLDPKYLALGNLLTQQATPPTSRRRRRSCRASGSPIRTSRAPFRRCCGRSRSIRASPTSTATSRDRTTTRCSSRPRSAGQTTACRWVSTTRSAGRKTTCRREPGYDFDQDWSVGANDQPHVWNATVVYDIPFGAEGRAGSGESGRAGDRQRLAGVGHHAVPIGPSARTRSARPAICRMRERATPTSTRPSADPCASTATTATAMCSARTRRPISIERRSNRPRRSPTATRRGRSRTTCGTRATSTRTSAYAAISPSRRARLGFGFDVFNLFNNVVFGGIQTNITNANFGRVSSQTNTPRVGQIKMRLEF